LAWRVGLLAKKFLAEKVCLSLMVQSMFPLNWLSRKVEMPDCGESPDAVVADGMANSPEGSRAFRMLTAMGLMAAAGRPKAAASPAAVRLLSVSAAGMTGNVRLLLSDAPLRSRVPWYEAKKKTFSLTTGPPSVPPYCLRVSTGRGRPAALRKKSLAFKESSRRNA
jgi:hypothetical protein